MFTLKHNFVAFVLAISIPTLMAVALAQPEAPDYLVSAASRAVTTETAVSTGDDDQLPANIIRFDFDSSAIDDAHVLQLDAAARWLLAHPDHRLVVESHTDAIGARLYNLDLADRRGTTVRRQLVDHGAAADRVIKVLCGEGRALAASPAANRRVVVYATKLDFDGLVRATLEPCYPVIL